MNKDDEITKLKRQVKFYKYHYLTGLKQRHDFEYDLRKQFETNECFCLIMVDVNGLHETNRVHSYATGDSLLIQVANDVKRIADNLGECYHISGDEFFIICESGAPINANGKNFYIPNSEFGIVCQTDDNKYISVDEMIDAVDELVITKKRKLKKRRDDI